MAWGALDFPTSELICRPFAEDSSSESINAVQRLTSTQGPLEPLQKLPPAAMGSGATIPIAIDPKLLHIGRPSVQMVDRQSAGNQDLQGDSDSEPPSDGSDGDDDETSNANDDRDMAIEREDGTDEEDTGHENEKDFSVSRTDTRQRRKKKVIQYDSRVSIFQVSFHLLRNITERVLRVYLRP